MGHCGPTPGLRENGQGLDGGVKVVTSVRTLIFYRCACSTCPLQVGGWKTSLPVRKVEETQTSCGLVILQTPGAAVALGMEARRQELRPALPRGWLLQSRVCQLESELGVETSCLDTGCGILAGQPSTHPTSFCILIRDHEKFIFLWHFCIFKKLIEGVRVGSFFVLDHSGNACIGPKSEKAKPGVQSRSPTWIGRSQLLAAGTAFQGVR